MKVRLDTMVRKVTARALCLLAVCLGTAAAPAADFREIPGDGQVLVLDLSTMRIDHDVRSLRFYIVLADEPSTYARSEVDLDCLRRLSRVKSLRFAKLGSEHLSKPYTGPEEWQKADIDATSTQLANLICAASADRDRYARRMPQSDLQSAIRAVAAELHH